jgi:hypothetical protein
MPSIAKQGHVGLVTPDMEQSLTCAPEPAEALRA